MSYARISTPKRFTYSVASGSFTPANSATDVFTIDGAANKRIWILSLWMSASQTTAGQFNVRVAKRSTVASGGTATTLTPVPHQSNIPACSAVVKNFTANPTTGTLVGYVSDDKVFIPQTITAIQPVFEWNFESLYAQPIELISATEELAVNFAGVTLTGGAVSFGAIICQEDIR